MDPGQKRQGLSKYEETNFKTSLELPESSRYEDGQNSDIAEALRLRTDTSNILINPSVHCQNDDALKISKSGIKTASPTSSRESQKDKQQFELVEGGKSRDDNLSKSSSQNSALEISKKYEENLARYLKETENCIKIRFRKKKIENERLIKSDGEIITKTTDVSKISSILSKLKIGRSSAPSTFSDEKENSKKMAANKIPIFSAENENNFRDCKQSATEIFKLPVLSPTDILPTKASEMKQNTSKILLSPTYLGLPDNSAKSETDSYKPPKAAKSPTTTPSPTRPSDLNVKRRQAFYIFAPGSSTGILRQCKSLPEISRFRRREAMQRWSMNFEQHLRNVSFGNEPRQSTQEVRSSSDVGTVYISVLRMPNEASEISRAVPQERGTDDSSSLLLDRRPENSSKTALLIYDDSNEMGNTECFEEAESFQKRKEISPVTEYPFTSAKKGRISSEFKKNEIDTIDEGTEDNLTKESKTSPSEKDENNK